MRLLPDPARQPARPTRWRAGLAAGLGATLLTGAAPLEAADGGNPPTALEVFQQREDRLFQVGYRLAVANAPFCNELALVAGFLIHDAAAYGDPAMVRRVFALSDDIGIQAVAPGSPAAMAGMRRNDTLLTIDGIDIAGHWPPTRPGWKRGQTLRAAIAAALEAGRLSVGWSRPSGEAGSAELTGVAACASDFELLDSGKGAAADGKKVQVDADFPGFAYAEEEFAAAIAHELAHNVLGHQATFERYGRKGRLVRLSERDADRLMPWLLANAGYDPSAAVRFMRRWGPRHDGGLLRNRSHDGWDERAEFIAAELPKIAAAIAADGQGDWMTHFERQLRPQAALDEEL